MMPLDDDRDLRDLFQAARRAEGEAAPPFARVLAGRSVSTPRRRWLKWTLAATAALAGIVLIAKVVRPPSGPAQALEIARELSSWRSPTEFLLRVPGAELLGNPPRLGEAPAGSPLKALDPGGPLGPPVTLSRRIRS
ncbi:MAG TPA: hypothetical protein VGQ17_07405 [Gemmatimonadales bacterium]|jgi:hypothetical protein|nr:hypothetical protein [Gemmatimonadales bacterium]